MHSNMLCYMYIGVSFIIFLYLPLCGLLSHPRLCLCLCNRSGLRLADSWTLSRSQANIPEPFRAQHAPQSTGCDWSGWLSVPALSAARYPDTPLFRVCKILTYASNNLLSLSCVPLYVCDGRQCMAVSCSRWE